MFHATKQGFGRLMQLRDGGGERVHGQRGHLARVFHAARGGRRRGALGGGTRRHGWAEDDKVRGGHGWDENGFRGKKTKQKRFAGIGGSRRLLGEKLHTNRVGVDFATLEKRARAGATFLNALCVRLGRRRKEKKGIDRGAVDVNVKRPPTLLRSEEP